MNQWLYIIWCMVLTCASLPLGAQQPTSPYPEITLARNDDGTDLKATFISFASGLKSSMFTEGLPYLVLEDNDGVIRIYDLTTLKTMSEIKPKEGTFAQVTRDRYLVYKNSSFLKADRVPTVCDFNNQKVWTSRYDIVLSDRLNNVAVCYQLSMSKGWSQGNMVGYNLSNGEELWRVTIPQHRHSAWCNVYHPSGTPYYYLMADSLVRLNILTGDTVRHAFKAAVDEPMKSVFSIVKARSFNSGAWTREAVHSYSSGIDARVLTGTHSGWVVNGDTLYVADADHLYAFDRDLKPLWQTALPDGVGAFSQLREDGGRLMLVGFGEAFQNGYIGRCGKPFAAYYDKSSGRQLAFQLVNIKEKVTGGCIVPGRVYWEDDKGYFFTNEGDTTATRIAWKPKSLREPLPNHPDRIICDTVGVLRNGKLELITTDRNQLVVELYGKDVYLIQTDGTAQMIKAEDVYFHDLYDLYSTNAEPSCHYVRIDPVTHRVKQGFTTTGKVSVNKSGDIFIRIKNGLGIVRNHQPNYQGNK